MRKSSYSSPLPMRLVRIKLCGRDTLPLSFAGEFKDVQIDPGPYDWYRKGTFDFRVVPSPPRTRKSSTARVQVKCPCCHEYIPAGRIGQHEPACRKHNEVQIYNAATLELERRDGVTLAGSVLEKKSRRHGRRLRRCPWHWSDRLPRHADRCGWCVRFRCRELDRGSRPVGLRLVFPLTSLGEFR